MTTKTFAKRDSATAALRKFGIAKENYNSFIEREETTRGVFFNIRLDDGKPVPYKVEFTPAVETKIIKSEPKIITRSESVAKRDAKKAAAGGLPDRSMSIDKPATTPKVESAKNKAMSKHYAGRRTVSSAIRDLIKAGKSNSEIWAVVQPEFKLADDKKHYPGWYRSELTRKGVV